MKSGRGNRPSKRGGRDGQPSHNVAFRKEEKDRRRMEAGGGVFKCNVCVRNDQRLQWNLRKELYDKGEGPDPGPDMPRERKGHHPLCTNKKQPNSGPPRKKLKVGTHIVHCR
jgi:hypothetical protein